LLQAKQHELLAQLTRILTQRLTPPTAKEESDEYRHASTHRAKQVAISGAC
jgi:hypothetical protein